MEPLTDIGKGGQICRADSREFTLSRDAKVVVRGMSFPSASRFDAGIDSCAHSDKQGQDGCDRPKR